ncbi:NmrA family NAD(P)-binding protein [Streptomyces sp. NPDC047315]|uniref:NmrA family NAD(P)-binding protein n=1 Tax=Streptomyces sp. NPDC047315 TaxID=3155142 RepID=UPI0033DF7306
MSADPAASAATEAATASAPVLVTGATGKQGGATARALLAQGVPVRALVRDASTDRAKAVEALGAQLVVGDLRDRESLTRAAEGARAVFSVQLPLNDQGFDFDGEVAQGLNLIEAAKSAGVPQFVQTSVTGADQHTRAPGWAEGRWAPLEPYYAAKSAIQEAVRTAGFTHWTLIKPGFFMENALPSAGYLFPRGIEGGLVTPLAPKTVLPLVAADDIGAAAAAAIAAPERFHRVELELASERLSVAEIADVVSRSLDVPPPVLAATDKEILAAGMPEFLLPAQAWQNVFDPPAHPKFARELGIPLTRFDEWARKHLSPAQ